MARKGRSNGRMSHSIKKLQRRNGCNVKGTKRKSKDPVHPGHAKVSRPAQKRAAEAIDEMELDQKKATGTAERQQARAELGKRARLEEVARRRGISLAGPDATRNEDGSAAEAEAAAAAAVAAKRALATAPSNQRAFQRELARVLQASDVLLEVVDARDPMGCRCKPLEDAVLSRFHSKRVVIILNKVDLVPPDVTQRWLSYLRQYFPTLPFKASTQQKRAVGQSAASEEVGKRRSYDAKAYGGDQLLQLLKNYSRSLNMKTAITVGVVGYPNVGKSSVINSLKRAKAVNVGAKPGVTTTAQTVALDKKVKLMDCPGIVFARASTPEEEADVLLRNVVKVEKMEDPSIAIEAIIRRCGAERLARTYGIAAAFAGSDEFLTLVALKRGHLRKGGAADLEAAARGVLQDWNAGGVIEYHTEPPKVDAPVSVVGNLEREFDWSAEPPRVEHDGEGDEPMATVDAAHATPVPAHTPAPPASAGAGGAAATTPSAQARANALRATVQTKARLEKGKNGAKKARVVPAKAQAMHNEDDKFNFQHNRLIRKKQKAERKKKQKSSVVF